jgi:hypothetical protein
MDPDFGFTSDPISVSRSIMRNMENMFRDLNVWVKDSKAFKSRGHPLALEECWKLQQQWK